MTSNQPTYFFRYFDVRGRGEPLRWLLKVVGVEYKEERIAMDQWPSKKAEFEWGKSPMMEVDGVQVHQTTVIGRYLGKRHNLAPSDLLANARIEEVAESIHDVRTLLGKSFFARKLNKEAEMKEDYKTAETRATEVVQCIEKTIGKEGWIRSSKMTWVDVFVSSYLDSFEYYFDGIFDKTPKVHKLVNTVRDIPVIKSWIETRPPIHPFEKKM